MSEPSRRPRKPRQALPPSPEGPRPHPGLRGAARGGRAGRVRQPRAAPAAQEGPREGRLRRPGRRPPPPSWCTARCAGRAPTTPVIAACVDRPLREVDPPVLDVLSLGVHQLLGTRIPTHAAVSASVELARVVLGDGRAKFVNAVLRKVAQDDLQGWTEKVAPPYDEDPEDHLAVVHSHPAGSSARCGTPSAAAEAGIEELLAADNERPEVTLVARPGRGHHRGTAARGRRRTRALVAVRRAARRGRRARRGRGRARGAGRRRGRGQPAGRPRAGERPARRARREVARRMRRAGRQGGAAGRTRRRARGHAARLREQPHRAGLVAKALAGNPGPYQVIAADGTRPPWRPRHLRPGAGGRAVHRSGRPPPPPRGPLAPPPPRTWTTSPRSSAACCAPPSTPCAWAGSSATPPAPPHLAETRAVVADVLKQHPDTELIDARPLLPGVPALGDGPDVQLWPHIHGTDAMYLALIRRTA